MYECIQLNRILKVPEHTSRTEFEKAFLIDGPEASVHHQYRADLESFFTTEMEERFGLLHGPVTENVLDAYRALLEFLESGSEVESSGSKRKREILESDSEVEPSGSKRREEERA